MKRFLFLLVLLGSLFLVAAVAPAFAQAVTPAPILVVTPGGTSHTSEFETSVPQSLERSSCLQVVFTAQVFPDEFNLFLQRGTNRWSADALTVNQIAGETYRVTLPVTSFALTDPTSGNLDQSQLFDPGLGKVDYVGIHIWSSQFQGDLTVDALSTVVCKTPSVKRFIDGALCVFPATDVATDGVNNYVDFTSTSDVIQSFSTIFFLDNGSLLPIDWRKVGLQDGSTNRSLITTVLPAGWNTLKLWYMVTNCPK